MSSTLQLLLLLALIVLLAKAAGWLASRLKQPAVLGEILVGLVVGPSVLNLLHWSIFFGAATEEVVFLLAEIGVILLMLIAGLEVDLHELRRAGWSALLGGVFGVAFSLAVGWGIPVLLGYDSATAFAIGLLLVATSVSISAQTLIELGVLRRPEGIALLGAAVVDDILALLLLSGEMAFRGGQGGVGGILLVLGRMVLFLGVGGGLCLWGLPWLMRRVEHWSVSAAVPATVLIATLLIAWAADWLGGLATITGAFLVGLGLRRSTQHRAIAETMRTLGYTLFVPLFFVSVGLQADVRALNGQLLLLAGLLIVAAIAAKSVGNWLGAWLGGLPSGAAVRMGVGMIPRGEVSLIAAAVEIRAGWIGQEHFAVVVLIILVTAVLTPPLLKAAFRRTVAGPAQPGVG